MNNDNNRSLQLKQNLLLLKATQAVERAAENTEEGLQYYLKHFVFTLDEHDANLPAKRLPMEKEYLQELAHYFFTEPLLLVEKSRQMMVSWIMIACHLWDVQFHAGRRIFFQSKKETDANEMVNRAKFIYHNYPPIVRDVIYAKYPAKTPMAYLKLEFAKQNSIIQGTPQGADVLRQYTASRIFSDEMAFQSKAEEAFIAAKPTLVGGGSFMGVSSPNFKEFFYLSVNDQIQ